MLHAVIMAGGAGTRFWPESRGARPKQLLRLAGKRSMIQATVDRLSDVVPADRVLIVTGAALVEEIAAQLPQLPASAILGEPCKRDTAPCIGLAALVVSRDDPEATMAVLPADHVISPAAAFQQAIAQAAQLVERFPGRIVTLGITPTYPAESFGYIERGAPLAETDAGGAIPTFKVVRFREKPDARTAQKYLDSGSFYWNSGIFIWKAKTILDALAERQPKMLAHLQRIAEAHGEPDFDEVFQREFTAIEGISIDYAVMEHATDVVVLDAPFDWDDVGSWQALARLLGTDADGNTIDAKHIGLETRGTIVHSSDEHLIATVGLEDCIIVHTPDATLVANKHQEESIRELVKLIKDRGWEEYL